MRLMRHYLNRVGRFFDHPLTRLVVTLALFVTGVCELTDTLFERMIGTQIGVGHGMVLYAISEAGRLLHQVCEDVQNASELAIAVEVTDDSADAA